MVKDMAEVMQVPTRPASTTPDSAKSVVMKTVTAPRISKRSSSQRFIIQNPYHIYGFNQHSDDAHVQTGH
jgi:hypothetical protein